jgi:hypothetical protein
VEVVMNGVLLQEEEEAGEEEAAGVGFIRCFC